MSAQTEPTVDIFREYLRYDPDTGTLTWTNKHKQMAGKPAQGKFSDGYLSVGFKGKRYMLHRVAWLLHFGEWPEDQLDHINGIRDDNRIANLRSVTAAENSKNAKIPKNNTSGICGVRWRENMKKWQADIGFNNKLLHIGYFDNLLDAVAARLRAERKYGYHDNHGRKA